MIAKREWLAENTGEITETVWCPNCQDFHVHVLGFISVRPNSGGKGDMLCRGCNEVRIWDADVKYSHLPAECQLFVVSPRLPEENQPSKVSCLVAAMDLFGAKRTAQLYAHHYVPFNFSGDIFTSAELR